MFSSLRLGTIQRCLLLPLLYNTGGRQEKENKGYMEQKIRKLLLFADDMIIYIKNPKESTRSPRTNR